MKKVTIELSDESYGEMINLTNWMNEKNKLTGRSIVNNYTIEDFIKGSAITNMEQIEKFIPLSNQVILSKVKNRFKDIAKERNIRQIDIANTLGMNKSNLSVIFNNKEFPRMDTFFKIWALLRCPPIHRCIYFED